MAIDLRTPVAAALNRLRARARALGARAAPDVTVLELIDELGIT